MTGKSGGGKESPFNQTVQTFAPEKGKKFEML
jgi:hypothetical protein